RRSPRRRARLRSRQCIVDALHLSLTAVGGDSRFSRFPIGNHPRKARPAFNCQCRVVVTMRYISTFVTSVLSLRQSLAHSVATLRAVLRRIGWIHLDYHTAGAFSLARQDQDELTPSRVTDALGEMMIL